MHVIIYNILYSAYVASVFYLNRGSGEGEGRTVKPAAPGLSPGGAAPLPSAAPAPPRRALGSAWRGCCPGGRPVRGRGGARAAGEGRPGGAGGGAGPAGRLPRSKLASVVAFAFRFPLRTSGPPRR